MSNGQDNTFQGSVRTPPAPAFPGQVTVDVVEMKHATGARTLYLMLEGPCQESGNARWFDVDEESLSQLSSKISEVLKK